MDPSSNFYYLSDMGVLEVEVWHGGKWNIVFHEGGEDYGNVWNNASVDLSVSYIVCQYLLHLDLRKNIFYMPRTSLME